MHSLTHYFEKKGRHGIAKAIAAIVFELTLLGLFGLIVEVASPAVSSICSACGCGRGIPPSQLLLLLAVSWNSCRCLQPRTSYVAPRPLLMAATPCACSRLQPSHGQLDDRFEHQGLPLLPPGHAGRQHLRAGQAPGPLRHARGLGSLRRMSVAEASDAALPHTSLTFLRTDGPQMSLQRGHNGRLLRLVRKKEEKG